MMDSQTGCAFVKPLLLNLKLKADPAGAWHPIPAIRLAANERPTLTTGAHPRWMW